ncbi:MAG: Hsp20 family protein [Elusimicrobia bacterium]|nr:Hsp20 family protein [Elusimicrobiota bacterium]
MTHRTLAALLAVFAAVPVLAQEQAPSQPDSEQLGQDLLKNVDGWIGNIASKLDSDKPVTAEDFDSIFGPSFFSGSQDPIGDLEKVQQRVNARLGDKGKKFNEPYGKWMGKKLSPSDLNPEVVSDDEHVTVNLDAPKDAEDSMKVNIAGKLIKMSYTRRETRQETAADGSVSSSSFARTQRRAMAVPRGANPATYRVSAANGRVSIIFDRLKKGAKRPEASK